MAGRSWALLAGLLLVGLPGPGRAAEADLAGNWKLTLLTPDRPTLWLVEFAAKDGKWAGKMLARGEDIVESEVTDLSVTADRLRFTIKTAKGGLTFDGTMPGDGAKVIRGSLQLDELMPVQLERTTLKTLDKFEIDKETFAGQGNDQRYFKAAVDLLRSASEKGAKPEEVRGWAEKAYKAAEPFGPRFQRDLTQRIAGSLINQEGMAEVALNYARRAERLLQPGEPGANQYRTLSLVASALKKAGKADEAKEVEARLEKLDFGVKTEKYAGRKTKTDRAILVELFTGVQCPPCVAADLAFDGLGKTYKPSEVILLQYHLHIPGPDPLTNPDSEGRADFYGEAADHTPSLLLNGRGVKDTGGSFEDAPGLYQGLRGLLDGLLEGPGKAQLKASATQKGGKIDISAEVAEVEKPGEQLRLRLALVEEEVRYSGGNGLRVHHHVVRAFPGGVKGLAVKDKTAKQAVSVDLDQLRKDLGTYLTEFEKKDADNKFPNPQRPLDLKNLRVVAFLQNDASREVLQAVEVEVQPAP
jgi:hypothetical protein